MRTDSQWSPSCFFETHAHENHPEQQQQQQQQTQTQKPNYKKSAAYKSLSVALNRIDVAESYDFELHSTPNEEGQSTSQSAREYRNKDDKYERYKSQSSQPRHLKHISKRKHISKSSNANESSNQCDQFVYAENINHVSPSKVSYSSVHSIRSADLHSPTTKQICVANIVPQIQSSALPSVAVQKQNKKESFSAKFKKLFTKSK